MSVGARPFPARLGKYIVRKSRWLVDRIQKHWFDAWGGRLYVTRARRSAFASASRRADVRLDARTEAQAGRLYIDVSVICRSDAATGIQRVVRSVAFLLAQGVGDPEPIFIYAHKGRHQVVHLKDGGYVLTDERVVYAAGDTFVGLDYALDALWRMRGELIRMRRMGVRFWYVVHDFLPLTHPDWFSYPTVLRFRGWLAIIAGTADGFFCVSPPVERELRSVLRLHFGLEEGYRTVVIPMGWNLATDHPSIGLPGDFDRVLARLRAAPSMLMVGTIEPRKGHAEALAAMEHLWDQGFDANLVLVGGIGWKTDALCAAMENHREADKRLLMLGKVSDEALEYLYAACSGVFVPSLAEGFGLPVVEAIGRSKRVLARDLAVFSQHAGKGVTYFDADADTQELARAIKAWLTGLEQLDPPRPDLLATWRDTADVIYDTAIGADNAVTQKDVPLVNCPLFKKQF